MNDIEPHDHAHHRTPSTEGSAPGPAVPSRSPLTAVEARILGTLMEKARTVPDSYPLTLNTLLLGCNQKTSREPTMSLDEATLAQALDNLLSLDLVRQSSGGRTARYTHNVQRGIGVFEQAAVLLGMLMLRGPQTAGELRLNTERWYPFADISSVEAFLEELQDRSAVKGGPLVVKLPRAHGAREQRWAHLLCGPVDVTTFDRSAAVPPDASGAADRIARLEAEVVVLRRAVERLCAELGVAPPQADANADANTDANTDANADANPNA